MAHNAQTAVRNALVALLEGITTASGLTFEQVHRGWPGLVTQPGKVDAWVELDGWSIQPGEGRGPTNGMYLTAFIDWAWSVTVCIWAPTGQIGTYVAEREDEFGQAVTDVLIAYIRANVAVPSPVTIDDVVINRTDQLECKTEWVKAETSSSEFRLLNYTFVARQQRGYQLQGV